MIENVLWLEVKFLSKTNQKFTLVD